MSGWLNHHHLQYFRTIAQEGGISAAGRKLSITHSTLSTQLKQLEDMLGRPLFDRAGRRLVLTPFGEQVLTYAEAIHRLGTQLLDFSAGTGEPEQRRPFRVVVTTTLPKTIVFQLLAPVVADPQWGPIDLRERTGAQLLGDLTSARAHLALSDEPVVKAGVRSHLLGSSGLHWYATPEYAHRLRAGFPHSLHGAPFVLPAQHVPLRKVLDRWLVERGLRVRVAATADDNAMMRVLGTRGVGVFPVRDALRAEVDDLHQAVPVGPIEGVLESYYAVSLERAVKDEGVALVLASARSQFGKEPQGRARPATRRRR
jgi:LysR family transcriptional activator of nhaA